MKSDSVCDGVERFYVETMTGIVKGPFSYDYSARSEAADFIKRAGELGVEYAVTVRAVKDGKSRVVEITTREGARWPTDVNKAVAAAVYSACASGAKYPED